MEAEKNKKRQRAGFVNYINRIYENEVKNIMDMTNVDAENMNLLISQKQLIEDKLVRIVNLNEEIAAEVDDEDEEKYEKEMNDGMDLEVSIKFKLQTINSFLASKSKSSSSENVSTSRETVVNFPKTVKLPTLHIEKFNGNANEYQTFIDSFQEAVHKNKTLSNVQKMNYLAGFLSGEALSCIKGLRLSNENYPKALDMLKERFGNPQILISVHMNKILELESVSSVSNVKQLRNLYDSIETQIRNLESLNLNSNEYGAMLIPILMSKVPNEVKLILSREKDWNLQNILQKFKQELEAREKVSYTNSLEANSDNTKIHTGISLYAQTTPKEKVCVFCLRKHKEQNCDIITKENERKNILIKERRCFCCLKIGHSLKVCRSNNRCFKCRGKHHVSICLRKEPKERDSKQKENENTETNAPPVNEKFSGVTEANDGSVFLQTAKANVYSEVAKAKLRLLLDPGSQISYISPRASKTLKLKPVGKKEICIKSFGENSVTKHLDVMKFNIECKDKSNIQISALCNEICHPLKNQNFNKIASEFPEIASLELADSNPENAP